MNLYGDYERIIDLALGGCPKVKKAVAEADIDGRRGLSTLHHHLRKNKAVLNEEAQRLLNTCTSDQEYWAEYVRGDMKSIRELPSGAFQVRISFEGNTHKQTFSTHEEARSWRDKVSLLFDSLKTVSTSDDSEGSSNSKKVDFENA